MDVWVGEKEIKTHKSNYSHYQKKRYCIILFLFKIRRFIFLYWDFCTKYCYSVHMEKGDATLNHSLRLDIYFIYLSILDWQNSFINLLKKITKILRILKIPAYAAYYPRTKPITRHKKPSTIPQQKRNPHISTYTTYVYIHDFWRLITPPTCTSTICVQ